MISLENMSSVPTAKYDIAIVGSGPAGMATACLIGSLNKNLKIIVFDKRPETTRNHKLAIGSDSIKAMTKLLIEGLASPTDCVNETAARELLTQFSDWSKKSIPTSTIETTLAKFAKEKLNISVNRDERFNIKHVAENQQKKPGTLPFDDFLKRTGGAKVVIGADGSKSEIRNVIASYKTDIWNLGYLVELKYTPPHGFKPRSYFKGSRHFVMANGFDFETAGKPRNGNPGVITLHKFVSYQTHQNLINGNKGTPENPWTMSELQEHLKNNEKVKKIFDHFECYLGNHTIKSLLFNKIVTFPMTIYRSSSVAKMYKDRVVLLVGDASSGLVLERGVNKAFIEASLCSKAVLNFFNRKKENLDNEESTSNTSSVQELEKEKESVDHKMTMEMSILPVEFIQYQKQSFSLFKREARWARFKHFILNSTEFLLKVSLFPFKLIWIAFAFFRRKLS